jgi:D-hexose-6-phosphate mutarotase
MILNPGKAGVKELSDIPHHDWGQFFCVELVNSKQPQLVKREINLWATLQSARILLSSYSIYFI